MRKLVVEEDFGKISFILLGRSSKLARELSCGMVGLSMTGRPEPADVEEIVLCPNSCGLCGVESA